MSARWNMQRALRLAKKGEGRTLPNPMVGCVITKDGEKISEGFHQSFGEDHAEVEALKNIDAKGASLFVTLEPCCHEGKTPPCTDTIIKSGIKKVIIATLDPSKKVSGKGMKALEDAGIEVELGMLEDEAKELNRNFFTFHNKKRPFITLKAAVSLDGKISAKKSEQTKLTGKKAQKNLHILRSKHEAILVGEGTVVCDDPHLGVRLIEAKDPLRVILKGSNELSKKLQIFRDENVLLLENKSIDEVLSILYEKGITSLLVEGGQKVFTSFLKAKKIDEVKLYIAPVILGERGIGFSNLEGSLSLSTDSVQKLGQDTLITATPQWDSSNG